ncbi:hypothetical protein DPMN_126113 [Dreissena polymorpha]|uniref:Uncharacterized protein n=1 Tax=Dreissena polymorpha TaxID=45954 RepID=A0A9D4GZJ4_DREPO|nr:hypothetical protein DPMN_126113 [Dreissena polymorpha]
MLMLGSYISRPRGSVRCMESAVKDLESRCFTSQTKASHMVKVQMLWSARFTTSSTQTVLENSMLTFSVTNVAAKIKTT